MSETKVKAILEAVLKVKAVMEKTAEAEFSQNQIVLISQDGTKDGEPNPSLCLIPKFSDPLRHLENEHKVGIEKSAA